MYSSIARIGYRLAFRVGTHDETQKYVVYATIGNHLT